MTKTMKAVAATALTVMSLMMTSVASAGTVVSPLELRLNGKAVYDPVANLTWLQDANYARTTGYNPVDYGRMDWYEAMSWVRSLNIDGVTGWRLPLGPMDYGWNPNDPSQKTSEMDNLFFNVLAFSAYAKSETQEANLGLFKNVNSGFYWSGLEYNPAGLVSPVFAWFFDAAFGQHLTEISNTEYVWAVHSGDVGASPVPVPGALVLMGPAVLGLLGVNHRRRRNC